MSESKMDDSHFIVDLRKVSTLPNGDMVQQRPRGYERPNTEDVSDLEREALARQAASRPEGLDRHAFQTAAERRHHESAQDVIKAELDKAGA